MTKLHVHWLQSRLLSGGLCTPVLNSVIAMGNLDAQSCAELTFPCEVVEPYAVCVNGLLQWASQRVQCLQDGDAAVPFNLSQQGGAISARGSSELHPFLLEFIAVESDSGTAASGQPSAPALLLARADFSRYGYIQIASHHHPSDVWYILWCHVMFAV